MIIQELTVKSVIINVTLVKQILQIVLLVKGTGLIPLLVLVLMENMMILEV